MSYKIKKKDCIVKDGVKLYRIVAEEDNPKLGIKKGDLGGYVSDYDCLNSLKGAWIFDGSFVSKSKVYGHSVVNSGCYIKNGSVIKDNARVRDSIVDNAVIGKNAYVGHSTIENGATVSGDAVVHTYHTSEYSLEDSQINERCIVSGNVIITNNAEILGSAVVIDSDKTFVIGDYTCIINGVINKPSDLEMVKYCERDGSCECMYTDANGVKMFASSDEAGVDVLEEAE